VAETGIRIFLIATKYPEMIYYPQSSYKKGCQE